MFRPQAQVGNELVPAKAWKNSLLWWNSFLISSRSVPWSLKQYYSLLDSVSELLISVLLHNINGLNFPSILTPTLSMSRTSLLDIDVLAIPCHPWSIVVLGKTRKY